jgi:hypothetical protein
VRPLPDVMLASLWRRLTGRKLLMMAFIDLI